MGDEENRKGPDEVIYEIGGCGRFQIRIATVIHSMTIIVVWTIQLMFFVGASPTWWCTNGSNTTYTANNTLKETCIIQNGTECSTFEFSDDMHTIVNEWSLVCDTAWIPATMSTIQIGFQLLGNFISGHIAEAVGRKVPIYLSLILLILFNLLSYFSVSWMMYAILRAFIGVSMGLFLTVRYNYMSEFSLSRWRTWLIAFPSWSTQACLIAPVLWWLKDWRNAHLATSLIGIPFIATWWLIPESFRWYYAHDRIDDAERVVTSIAMINRRPKPDMTYMKELTITHLAENKQDKKYTALDLFKSRFLVKITLLLSFVWFAQGIASYGIFFGIQNLSGSIYMNLFLFPLVEIPPRFLQPWLLNRFGRRVTCMCLFGWVAITTLVVGVVQNIDTEHKDSITRWFALAANIGISAIWPTMQTMAVESFPTVVRNIGFGFCSVLARVGAMLGPQLAFLEDSVAGLLYFCCGIISVMSVVALVWLPETKDSNLCDRLNEEITREQVHKQPEDPKNRII